MYGDCSTRWPVVVEFSPDELELLRKKVKRGSDVSPIPRIPDSTDIAPEPKAENPPVTPPGVEGLVELASTELPEPGKHFVVWGSEYLNDIEPRRVKRTAPMTLEAYVRDEEEHTKALLSYKLKNPTHRGGDRVARTRTYAAWRYRGYVCGEIVSL